MSRHGWIRRSFTILPEWEEELEKRVKQLRAQKKESELKVKYSKI